MIQPEMVDEVLSFLDIPESSFWNKLLCREFSRNVRFLQVKALTNKARFRKLVLKAYQRLYEWMETYKKAYEDLKQECRAVNENIKAFQNKFDLLTILSFLRSMDVITLEQKHYLGENFSAEEVCSIDEKLCFFALDFERFDVPPPVSLPPPNLIKDRLLELANEVYRTNEAQAKHLLE
jgi:hypothetical protein